MFFLTACHAKNDHSNIILTANNQLIFVKPDSSNFCESLKVQNIPCASTDKIFYRNQYLPIDSQIPQVKSALFQLEKSHQITLITPEGAKILQTTAPTAGEAVAEVIGYLSVADYIHPLPETPITADIVIVYIPADLITVESNGKLFHQKTYHKTIGKALSGSGLSITGMDKIVPSEIDPLPQNEPIHIIRTREEISLSKSLLPFKKIIEYGPELSAGEQKVLQAGEYGIRISRTSITLENENEIFRSQKNEITIRQPLDSIIRISNHPTLQTLNTSIGELQYWRAAQMYTTSYSPCRSGTSKCSPGTASGTPLRFGIVATTPQLYNQLAGTRVYIPGYGIGVIADVGGGFPDGRPWIDLGYADDNYQPWSGYHTVYFLAPAPEFIPDGLN